MRASSSISRWAHLFASCWAAERSRHLLLLQHAELVMTTVCAWPVVCCLGVLVDTSAWLLPGCVADHRRVLQNALATSNRVANLFIGNAAAKIRAMHPPASVLSIAIDSDDLSNEFATEVVPGGTSTRVATAVQCQPSANFADANPPANTPRCANLTLTNMVVSDGLLPSYMHTPPGQWGDVLQVYKLTQIIPRWSAITTTPLAGSPHSVALQLGDGEGDNGLTDCMGVDPPTGEGTPTLRALLCGLVQRADKSANATAQAPVPAGGENSNVVEQVLEGSATGGLLGSGWVTGAMVAVACACLAFA